FHVCLLIPSPPRPLYSFPTRRSSDLYLPCLNSHQQEPYALNALQTYLVIISDWDKGNITTNFIKMYDRLLIYQQPRRLGLNHRGDRKSTRLNASHVSISYAVFCLKNK